MLVELALEHILYNSGIIDELQANGKGFHLEGLNDGATDKRTDRKN